MFGKVAPRYDLLNRVLSLRVDQYWRSRLVTEVRPYLERKDLHILDLCCGTGDVLIALENERRRINRQGFRPGLGSDFCRPMLSAAKQKLEARDLRPVLVEADALHLPLPDACLDLITIAWGFRNLANYERGLLEMFRLLAPGGCLAILEFSEPRNRFWGPLYGFYFRHVLPRIGNALSGSGNAYSYLQQSVRSFLSPEELKQIALSCGFARVSAIPLTGGISVLHLAYK